MSRGVEVPVTKSVLQWALKESGLASTDVAKATGVSVEMLESWLAGDARPKLTQFKKLATKLHRPQAMFLLPKPPAGPTLTVQFRSSRSDDGRELNPTERRLLRRARRFQEVLAWIIGELQLDPPGLPQSPFRGGPVVAAGATRERLGVSVEDQLRWPSASKAFDHWRDATEVLGVSVLLFSMGKDSVQGFSLFDGRAPIIAVNTSRREEARMFTLFHELGHLLTRTSSACAGASIQSTDPVERWCDAFAAEVLAPRQWVIEQAAFITGGARRVDALEPAAALARRFKISLRACVLALIQSGLASWDLYGRIPPASDAKAEAGGGGTGRSRLEIRGDEFGKRTAGLFVTAVNRDVLSRSQALDYLDVPDTQFDRIPAMSIPDSAR